MPVVQKRIPVEAVLLVSHPDNKKWITEDSSAVYHVIDDRGGIGSWDDGSRMCLLFPKAANAEECASLLQIDGYFVERDEPNESTCILKISWEDGEGEEDDTDACFTEDDIAFKHTNAQ